MFSLLKASYCITSQPSNVVSIGCTSVPYIDFCYQSVLVRFVLILSTNQSIVRIRDFPDKFPSFQTSEFKAIDHFIIKI